jgi:hypothetical protein
VTTMTVAITDAKVVTVIVAFKAFNVWTQYEGVLVHLSGITWYKAYSGCKSVLGNHVASYIHGLLITWFYRFLGNLLLEHFWRWI